MTKKPSDLDNIIAPEIKNDDFYEAIKRLASREKIRTVLEIGSSSGGGSTSAFIEGLSQNPNQPTLYCMEVSKARFEQLQSFCSRFSFVKCYNCSSVGLNKFPSEDEVANFLQTVPSGISDNPVSRVVGWLKQDIAYIQENNSPEDGIQIIKRENKIKNFDMVLIDGSEFTGKAELDETYGAKFILLDDINSFKNRENYDRLKADSAYDLIEENWHTRLGYAIFKRKEATLPIHFFTIVLNGKPFIDYHIKILESLSIPWHWHIVEGVADLVNDTAWGVPQGAKIPADFHNHGLSVDGTSEYLDELEARYSDKISVYRRPVGQFWNGKLEMVGAPLENIKENCLLWQLDSDEFWNKQQIEKMHEMFIADSSRTAAWFWCKYYVGPNLIISTRNCYAMDPRSEWLRVWRYKPGMTWATHEPPALAVKGVDGLHYDVGKLYPFSHDETEKEGLVFEHFAYVTESQLQFKESYYGYKGAVESWKRMQQATNFPIKLKNYFAWVTDETEVISTRPVKETKIHQQGSDPRDRMALQSREQADIVVDGVFFQISKTGISRLWSSILKCWSEGEIAKKIIVLDREGTAPKFKNIRYKNIPAYHIGNMDNDSVMLEKICDEVEAKVFISTYYTKPLITPTLQMVYDMIPEALQYDLVNDARWKEKQIAFSHASKFVCISEYSKQDLIKFRPNLVPSDVDVVYPAYDPKVFYPASSEEIIGFYNQHDIKRPYFILVGPAKGYKNIELFEDAMRKLPSQWGFEAILVGGWISPEEVSSLKVGCNVRHLKLNDEQLRIAYSGSMGLIYPSKYEGFGLPVLEAMACSCPVITTRFTSIPEAAGNAVLYADDAPTLINQMCEVQKPDVRRKLWALAQENLKRFSWESSANQLENIINNYFLRLSKQCAGPGTAIVTASLGSESRS